MRNPDVQGKFVFTVYVLLRCPNFACTWLCESSLNELVLIFYKSSKKGENYFHEFDQVPLTES
jgi:hypothetical protein